MDAKLINISHEKTQNIANNLTKLIKNHNLTITQISRILNVPIMTIRRLTSGETNDPRISTLKLLADYFDVSIDSLIEDVDQSFKEISKKTKPFLVPILNWDIAGKINNIDELDLSKWDKWQPVPLNEKCFRKKSIFALESRPSLYPRFPQNTIFIIDPDSTPTDGDIILVKIKENNELTLRELIIDPPEWRLYSIVLSSDFVEYSKDAHTIMGINLLTLLYNRKV